MVKNKNNFLNDVSKSLKMKHYDSYDAEQRNILLRELITVIQDGTEHQGQRALNYMKAINKSKDTK